jgi:hypothetical protein
MCGAAAVLEDHSPFSEGEARFYLAELVLAIAHLHAHGIVHRDLKATRPAPRAPRPRGGRLTAGRAAGSPRTCCSTRRGTWW